MSLHAEDLVALEAGPARAAGAAVGVPDRDGPVAGELVVVVGAVGGLGTLTLSWLYGLDTVLLVGWQRINSKICCFVGVACGN